MRLYIRRYLGEDVALEGMDVLLRKYAEAQVMRKFDVDVMREAIIRALGGGM